MLRNLLGIGLSCVLLSTAGSRLVRAQSQAQSPDQSPAESQALAQAEAQAVAQTQTQAVAQVVHNPHTDKIATRVAKLGRGRRIKVKLVSRDTIRGVLGEIGEDRFTLIDPSTHTVTSIAFDKVQEVKNNEPNQWKFAAISAAVVGGIMLMVVLSLRGS